MREFFSSYNISFAVGILNLVSWSQKEKSNFTQIMKLYEKFYWTKLDKIHLNLIFNNLIEGLNANNIIMRVYCEIFELELNSIKIA